VTPEAVRAHLEQRRRLVAPRALDRAPHGVTHGHDVHASTGSDGMPYVSPNFQISVWASARSERGAIA